MVGCAVRTEMKLKCLFNGAHGAPYEPDCGRLQYKTLLSCHSERSDATSGIHINKQLLHSKYRNQELLKSEMTARNMYGRFDLITYR
jgi:hypothetical protein